MHQNFLSTLRLKRKWTASYAKIENMFDDKIVLINIWREITPLQGFSESAFFAHVPICHLLILRDQNYMWRWVLTIFKYYKRYSCLVFKALVFIWNLGIITSENNSEHISVGIGKGSYQTEQLKKGAMPRPGFEPGLLRPQRRVLTTRRSRLGIKSCSVYNIILKSSVN